MVPDLTDPATRRSVLEVGTVALTSGVLGGLAGFYGDGSHAEWPMRFGDARNTRGTSATAFESAPEGAAWKYPADPDGIFTTTGPVVADGTLFAGVRAGRRATGDWSVHAVDAHTGERRWHRDLDVEYVSAPLVHRGVVVVPVESEEDEGVVYGIDARDGTTHWSVEGPTRVKMAHRDQVYVGAPNSEGRVSSLVALGIVDGERRWSVPYASPSPVATHDRVFVVGPDQTIHAYDARDGRQRWQRNVDLMSTLSTDGTRLYSFVDGPEDGFGVSAFDLVDGTPHWSVTVEVDRFYPPPVVTPDRVVVHSFDRIQGLDPVTGEQVWSQAVKLAQMDEPNRRINLVGEPVAAGDVLLQAVGSGSDVGPRHWGVLQATDLQDGTRRWQTDGDVLPSGVFSYGFAVAHDTLYVRQSSRIHAIRSSE